MRASMMVVLKDLMLEMWVRMKVELKVVLMVLTVVVWWVDSMVVWWVDSMVVWWAALTAEMMVSMLVKWEKKKVDMKVVQMVLSMVD